MPRRDPESAPQDHQASDTHMPHERLLENMLEGFAHCRMIFDDNGLPVDWVYLDVNPAFARLTGLADVVGKRVSEAIPGTIDEHPELLEICGRVAATGVPEKFEIDFKPLNLFLRVSAFSPAKGQFVATFEDVTAHKRAELAQTERERFLSTLMTHLQGMVYRCADDAKWTTEFASAGCTEITGYPPEALIGNAEVNFEDLTVPEYRAAVRREVHEAIARNEPWTYIFPIITAGGDKKWVCDRGAAVRDARGDVVALEGLITDVTARHQAEQSLAQAAAEWRQTFDAMQDSVAVFDSESRLLRCNTATAGFTGRELENLLGRRCFEVFHGTTTFHPDCPRQRALESGKVATSTLEQNGRWLRVSFHPMLDAQAGVSGGVHVLTDITDLKDAEQRLLESVAKQQAVTEGIIATLARVVEARDPYTAGHERRVSELAVAIAACLGLDEDRTHGVRVAGMLHDVGKISIPAEILARPGRLSAAELELIKGHPQTGFDILEAIEFPWLVAEMTLQHHERLDGSGYPRGLRDKEMLLEARILAVADVVEAMSSHRPYRPALGVEAALDEIRRGAGRLYDTRAVQACVELFAHRDFAFSA